MALPVRTYGDGILIITGDSVRGQDAVAASGSAGSVLNLRGGDGDGVGDAGGVLVDGGAAGASANAAGGDVTLQGTNSAATGTGNGGNVVFIPGLAQGSGTNGIVRIDSSAPDSSGLLQFDNSGGTNGVIVDVLVGDRDPSVVPISARKGTLYLRNAGGATVGSAWINTSTTDPGTTWTDITGGGAASTWSAVLAAGASTGANNPVIDDGQAIIGEDQVGVSVGSYTIRGGNQTQASGSFIAGDLTISGGDNSSSASGARGGNVILQGGSNTVGTSATGGSLTVRAGSGGIGGDLIVGGGEGLAGNAAGDATFHGGDNFATGRGGNAVFRGGNATAGSGSDAGGTLLLEAGTARGNGTAADVTIRGGQPGGTTSTSGDININTDITVGGNTGVTGSIIINTGDTARNSSLSLSGAISLTTGTHTGTGSSGGLSLTTGDSANEIGAITLQGGDTSSGAANRTGGDVNIITGDRTNAGSDVGARAGNITFTLGTSANPNTTGPGGSFTVTGGPSTATSANGRGGSITLTGGVYSGGTANGLAGSVSIAGGAATGAAGNAGGVTITGGAPAGNSSTAGDVTIAGGDGDLAGTSSTGGDVSVTGGAGGSTGAGGDVTVSAGAAGTSNSNGGSVTITATARTGVGTDGALLLQTTRSSTTDDATVSIDTENGSFVASQWHHMTAGAELAAGAGLTTVVSIGGPTVNGQNLKLRVWATAQLQTTTADMMSELIETSFVRTAGATTELPRHTNSRITNPGGAINAAVAITLTISGSNILVEVTPDTIEATNFMLEIDWERGGMNA